MTETSLEEVDQQWMTHALTLAEQGKALGEVPVGAVLVRQGTVLGEGFNQPISGCDPSLHAEIVALRQAAKAANNYRLPGSTLYVTLEPCTMCIGALIHARIERLVYGTTEPKAGAVVSQLQLLDSDHYNHHIDYTGGVMADSCQHQLSDFFRERRAAAKAAKATAPQSEGQ
ncbi:tRNA adenosine(34) deaminase TadA [Marinimicrobium alkaliphilum]|uniref:tRNA adenosine(34) deaminase TadA n=1 Tax=Marinimicrobium alkaliphilum TaxID=2202654 RepID=UPI0018E08910|nr:tRNA adenosine(34) deaminase TadA [Marinimicrobium alkaliphilum]